MILLGSSCREQRDLADPPGADLGVAAERVLQFVHGVVGVTEHAEPGVGAIQRSSCERRGLGIRDEGGAENGPARPEVVAELGEAVPLLVTGDAVKQEVQTD